MGIKLWRNVIKFFFNAVLKGKLREAVRFLCEIEQGGFLKPDKSAVDCTGTINETVASVLEGKHPSEKNPFVLR